MGDKNLVAGKQITTEVQEINNTIVEEPQRRKFLEILGKFTVSPKDVLIDAVAEEVTGALEGTINESFSLDEIYDKHKNAYIKDIRVYFENIPMIIRKGSSEEIQQFRKLENNYHDVLGSLDVYEVQLEDISNEDLVHECIKSQVDWNNLNIETIKKEDVTFLIKYAPSKILQDIISYHPGISLKVYANSLECHPDVILELDESDDWLEPLLVEKYNSPVFLHKLLDRMYEMVDGGEKGELYWIEKISIRRGGHQQLFVYVLRNILAYGDETVIERAKKVYLKLFKFERSVSDTSLIPPGIDFQLLHILCEFVKGGRGSIDFPELIEEYELGNSNSIHGMELGYDPADYLLKKD